MNIQNQSRFVETYFDEGSLGVILRRRAEDGVVYVHEIIPDSQAVNIDVASGDELWAVGESEIGNTSLDKEAWDGLISFIRKSSRPLKLIWHRRLKNEVSSSPIAPLNANAQEVETEVSGNLLNGSSEYLELQNHLSRIVVKDKDGSRNFMGNNQIKRFPDPMSLLVDGRRIIKVGDLYIETRSTASLWMKMQMDKRHIVLTNDLLLITVPLTGNVYSLEYLIDLHTAKIKNVGYSFGLENDDIPQSAVEDDLSFEVLWPGGELRLIAEDSQSKAIWILKVFLAICDNVSVEGKATIGWYHNLLIGTMHSAVLRRNEEAVREIISFCASGRCSVGYIDSFDHDGFTPLHYACMLRLSNVIKLLCNASANIFLVDRYGYTALHWAAMQLDAPSLGVLCSCIDASAVLDLSNSSPLVLACIEGRDISGATDSMQLKECIQFLLPIDRSHSQWCDELGQTVLHYLAGSWQYEALDVLLQENNALVNKIENSLEMTPLHFAARGIPIKKAIGQGHKILNQARNFSEEQLCMVEDVHKSHGPDTIRCLLRNGGKPNQKDKFGRTFLQILLEPETALLWEDKQELLDAITIALSYGARPDDTAAGTLKTIYPELNFSALLEKWNSLNAIDGKFLDLRLGMYDKLTENASFSNLSISSSRSSPINTSPACILCGFVFTIFRRQHHCRLCSSLCCDDCSKKRVIIDNSQVRTCDCCYNQVYSRMENNRVASVVHEEQNRPQELNEKQSLFASSTVERVDTKSEKDKGKLGNTMNVMNETYQKLQERGEKLNRLADRTDDMVNQASEFARLAKQLNEQQKSRWF